MKNIHEWVNTGLIVLVVVLVLVGGNQSAAFGATGTRFPNGISADTTSPSAAGNIRGTTFTLTGAATLGGLTVGTNGTALSGLKTGSCTIWARATTIGATSTVQVECQSATNGSLASGLTGITSDSICQLTNASSTNTLSGSIVVAGVSASSTAGSIVARIANFTGTTFTWDSTASSSPKWQYTCYDPT